MKTSRFFSTVAFIAALMASAANAQTGMEVELLIMGGKWLWNKHAKTKEIKEKLEEIGPNYEGWIKSLEDYVSKTGKVGDCKTIGFRLLSDNSGQTKNFSYQCGTEDGGNIAFLKVINKVEIGSCGKGSDFKVEFDIRKNELSVLSLSPNCVFFQPSCKTLISGFCPPNMVFVGAGIFEKVTVESFCIGKYEVTQNEWQEVMGSNPSKFRNCGGNCPVEQVSWNDAQTFIRNLNAKTGMKYRLPTQAEWEYSARSGCNSENYPYSGGKNLGNIAWYYHNSSNQPHPVGTKQPNTLGIYDMSGNVWEWVNENGGIGNRSNKMARGGAWSSSEDRCRVTSLGADPPNARKDILGFRLVHPPMDKAALQKDCQSKGKVWENNACREKTLAEIRAERENCQANGKIWENNTCREKTSADVEAEKNTCQAGGRVWENNACREKTSAEIDTGKSTCQASGKVWENNTCREKTSAEKKQADQEELIKTGTKLLQKLFK